jgi:hypothetical protein
VQWNRVISNSCEFRWRRIHRLPRGLDTTDNGEREGHDESVEESIELLKHSHVLDEGSVPEETQHKGADQDNEHKGEEFCDGVLRLTRVNKSLNH